MLKSNFYIKLLIAFIIVLAFTTLVTVFVIPKNKQTSLPIETKISQEEVAPETSIAYIEDNQVVIMPLDSRRVYKTGIPVAWMDPKAIWCQGFDWSPNSQKILAFISPISYYDVINKKLIPIKNFAEKSISEFQWGKDSNSIYYIKGAEEETYVYDFATSTIKKISNYSMHTTNLNYPLSSSGKYLVIRKERLPYILNLQTGDLIEIIRPEENASIRTLDIMDVNWNPNEKEVAYMYTTNANDYRSAVYKLYRNIGIYNLETNTARRLEVPMSSVRNPVFSPNGKYILFENEDAQELWVVKADGSNPIRVGEKPVDFYKNPSWSPDSTKIVYGKVGEGVYLYDIMTKETKTISETGWCPVFGPK